MKNLATVPSLITQYITDFCVSITSDNTPLYINSQPSLNAKQGECFRNVRANLKSGDNPFNGWIIWQTSNHLLQAEFHCVIHHNNGNLECITPYHRDYTKILFLPEPNRLYEQKRTPTRYFPISDAKETKPFIDALEAIVYLEEMFSNNDAKEYINDPINSKKRDDLRKNIHDMEQAVENFERMVLCGIGPNSVCICGSEKKYKQCCGKRN
jgi:hypothetical protein